jgi:radical SAM-linked protein
MGKQGDMALVGHLDLMKLLDRMTRRASLPISFTGGYHPSPRIICANALPLGATSSGEIIEFDLTESMEKSVFLEILKAHLPADLPIYHAECQSVKSQTASQSLEKAEYLLTVSSSRSGLDQQQWREWIAAILDSQEIIYQKMTKSGKTRYINLREQLFELELVDSSTRCPSRMSDSEDAETVTLRYVGGCRNDGTQLRPEQILYMLEQVSQEEFQLLHIHRQRLILQ